MIRSEGSPKSAIAAPMLQRKGNRHVGSADSCSSLGEWMGGEGESSNHFNIEAARYRIIWPSTPVSMDGCACEIIGSPQGSARAGSPSLLQG